MHVQEESHRIKNCKDFILTTVELKGGVIATLGDGIQLLWLRIKMLFELGGSGKYRYNGFVLSYRCQSKVRCLKSGQKMNYC